MSPESEDRHQLLDLLKEHAIRFGQFTLTSGTKSSYYIDAKLATLIPKGFELIGRVMARRLEEEHIAYDAVGGLESGAIAIACSIAAARPVPVFFVRRNKKKHGTQKWIEGPLERDQRVLIVEDVVTTGSSVIKAITKVEDFGARVVKILVLVDRLQDARSNIIREHGSDFSYEAIYTIRELCVETNTSSHHY